MSEISFDLSVGTNVPTPVDDTLTVSGMAADAAATGNAIADIAVVVGTGTLPEEQDTIIEALTTLFNRVGSESPVSSVNGITPDANGDVELEYMTNTEIQAILDT